MIRILNVLAALVRATQADYVTVNKYEGGHIGVSLSHRSDADARATAAAVGVDLSLTGNSDEEWLRGETEIGDVRVSVYGMHHKRGVTPQSPSASIAGGAVGASLARAAAAVYAHFAGRNATEWTIRAHASFLRTNLATSETLRIADEGVFAREYRERAGRNATALIKAVLS